MDEGIMILASQSNLTSLLGSNVSRATSAEACALTPSSARYSDGSSTPTIGDTIYVDLEGATPLPGGNNWYKIEGYACVITSSGVITSIIIC